MVKHINKTDAVECATHAIEHMRANPGNWFIWADEEEGIFMARPTSPSVKGICKHWPEKIVGTFNGAIGKTELWRCIGMSRKGSRFMYSDTQHALRRREARRMIGQKVAA